MSTNGGILVADHAGPTGTLDPAATGMPAVCLDEERYTVERLLREAKEQDGR